MRPEKKAKRGCMCGTWEFCEVCTTLNNTSGDWNRCYDQWVEHIKSVLEIDMEKLAEQVHKAYCQYQLDNGKEYWTKGDYSKLDDATKEIDRYTVRAVLSYLKTELIGGNDEE